LVVDRNQFAVADALALALDAGYRLHRALELRVLATRHATDGRTENPEDEPGDGSSWNTAAQVRSALDLRGNVSLPRGAVLTIGGEREWQDEQTAIESISAFGTYTDESDEARVNTGWYTQLHGSLVSGVAVTLGGRIDDNEKFGTFRTGRAALSWQPAAQVRIHAALGTAFKEPTFYEQFAQGFVQGNPSLEPERARSTELGAMYSRRGVVISATAFDQRFRNLIQYTGSPAADAPNYSNIGAARARGAELGASAVLGGVTARASYTWTDTRVTDAGFGEDNLFQQDERLLRRPVHQATLGMDALLGASLRGSVDVRAIGEREDLDFTTAWQGARTRLSPYALVDVGAAWSRGAHSITARVRNVLDARYQEIHNFAAAGRVLELGLRSALDLR
ncbi:MAG TPA: TonB-dependent receptor, partial [Longimicrobiales bacterium]|nr:TonB-dependent receptor [Longimicrobiales bacterium]